MCVFCADSVACPPCVHVSFETHNPENFFLFTRILVVILKRKTDVKSHSVFFCAKFRLHLVMILKFDWLLNVVFCAYQERKTQMRIYSESHALTLPSRLLILSRRLSGQTISSSRNCKGTVTTKKQWAFLCNSFCRFFKMDLKAWDLKSQWLRLKKKNLFSATTSL